MRRTIGMAILGVAVGALPVLAQPAGEGPRGRRSPRGEALAEHLGLTEAQRAEWKKLTAEHRQRMRPLFEEGQALRKKSRDALENDEPAVVVGEAEKALHAHREKVRAANQEFEARLKAVLDDAQKEKYEAFRAARREGHRERSERGPREGRPRRGGPPDAEPSAEDPLDAEPPAEDAPEDDPPAGDPPAEG